MNSKVPAVRSLTLVRHGNADYRVTLWPDGVGRFDGRSGSRQGAWESRFRPQWFAWAARLAKDVEDAPFGTLEPSATIIVETADSQVAYEATDDDESKPFWLLGAVIDGLTHRLNWVPFDVTGAEDFADWALGTPVWIGAGGALASGLAANGSVLVLAGSYASTSTSASLEPSYKEVRAKLLDEGTLTLEADHFRLARHLRFDSPSAAASVLVGSNTSGRRAWRTSSGHTWSEMDLDS